MAEQATDVTQKLLAWRGGRQDALQELLPLVYDELRRLAHHQLRRHHSDPTTHSTTELVHEAYVRLVNQDRVEWRDRAHFFGLASNLMRNILVDHYRAKLAGKRGGGASTVPLDEAEQGRVDWRENIIELDEALNRLAAMDGQQGRIVELRFFGGLGIEETAEVIGIAPSTVRKKWSLARAWLHRELRK